MGDERRGLCQPHFCVPQRQSREIVRSAARSMCSTSHGSPVVSRVPDRRSGVDPKPVRQDSEQNQRQYRNHENQNLHDVTSFACPNNRGLPKSFDYRSHPVRDRCSISQCSRSARAASRVFRLRYACSAMLESDTDRRSNRMSILRRRRPTAKMVTSAPVWSRQLRGHDPGSDQSRWILESNVLMSDSSGWAGDQTRSVSSLIERA